MINFKITDKQIEALRPYIQNIDELIEGDIWNFQNELDDVIASTFRHDEPTDLSIQLEKIYDEIYIANQEY